MQHHCTELTEKLLKSLDKEYNVINMGAVVEVITTLEKTAITKEVLEITRLGKYINELRRKTNNEVLARRAKNLVRRWRDLLLPSVHSPQPTVADTAPPALNGAKPQSPALRSLKPQSPALRGLKPQSPLLKNATNLRVSSPALSVCSDNSRSPHESQSRLSSVATVTSTSANHRLNNVNVSEPSLDRNSKVQNHSSEAVPRTHSSNKRLRKDDLSPALQQHQHQQQTQQQQSRFEPPVKRVRLNGEVLTDNSSCSSLNSQVPSPATAVASPEPLEDDVVIVGGTKKRGRKKGSKSVKKCPEDSVKEKLASISRNPKLKTTQELLADLQARGSSTLPSHSINTPNVEVVLRNTDATSKYSRGAKNNLSSSHNNELLQSRLKSENDSHCDYASESQRIPSKCMDKCSDGRKNSEQTKEESDNREKPWHLLTAEEIMAKLPPLDLDAIDWGSDQEPEEVAAKRQQRQVTSEDITRLHNECLEGQNGNLMPRELLSTLPQTEEPAKDEPISWRTASQVVPPLTCPSLCRRTDDTSDYAFREYHEMLARYSSDKILHILPYVVVD